MATFQETTREIDVLGARLHYNEAGSGEPLICLHGGGPGANAWDNSKWVLDELAANFRVLLLDLPGYGVSEFIEALPNESREAYYARAVRGFMDALGIEKAHLYGPSMGSIAMIQLAHDHPERVLKLVLKSPAGLGPNLLTASPPDGIMALERFRKAPTYESMQHMMQLFIPRNELLTKEIVDARFASAQQAMALKPPNIAPGPGGELRQIVRKLTMPTLVLWGHQDRMVSLDGMLHALSLFPNLEVHVWGGGAGHFVEYEFPEAFTRVVIPFLQR